MKRVVENEQYQNRLVLNWDIDMKCQNTCDYCCRLDDLNTDKYSEDVYQGVKRVLLNHLANTEEFDNPDAVLAFLGGEPLLQKRTFEVVEELSQYDNMFFRIFTNLNFKESFRPLEKLKEFSDKYTVNVSIHESSNQDWLMTNVLKLNPENVECVFVLRDSNMQFIYGWYQFCIRNNLKFKIYEVHNTSYQSLFTLRNDMRYLEMIEHPNCLFYRTPKMKMTKCRINNFYVSPTGETDFNCQYLHEGTIDDIKIRDIFCKCERCVCENDSYKVYYE